MATPADQRLLDLLGKWLKSLELHLRYSSLDNDSYANIQPWPEHQRPSRWIIELAKQKAVALHKQIEERIKMGDAKFSDSLELMTFLANLLGSEYIERFIPVADPENERPLQRASPEAKPQALSQAPPVAPPAAPPAAPFATEPQALPAVAPQVPPAAPPPAQPQAPLDVAAGTRETGTREMPEFVATKRHTPPPVSTQHVARTERRHSPRPAPRTASKHPGRLTAPAKPAATTKPIAEVGPAPQPYEAPPGAAPADAARGRAIAATGHVHVISNAAREQVIADAARLVQWGRKWYELAEIIARMADRPPLPDVRRILKDNKTAIEKKAGRG
ncbi:MAG: hypothetical protein ACLP2F_03165 [Steroidobacteraceae bacterium]